MKLPPHLSPRFVGMFTAGLPLLALPSKIHLSQGFYFLDFIADGAFIFLSALFIFALLSVQYSLNRTSNERRHLSLMQRIATIGLSLLFVLILTVIISNVNDGETFGKLPFLGIFRFCLIGMFIMVVDYALRVTWISKIITLEKEQLINENLKTQFQLLRQQINPHFLFNSLNVLKVMVKENDPSSADFIIRLSDVYRYLLTQDSQEMVTLDKEIEMLNNYWYMLKARFGDSITLHIEVQNEYLDSLIPPFTLQVLVENAIKHNSSSMNHPLSITITANARGIVVRNNLRPRASISDSLGIGLSNIARRYTFIGREDISIKEEDGFFSVKLPVIMI